MSYRVTKKLDKDSAQAVEMLENLFSGDERAELFLEKHRFRCANDVDNILSLGHPEKILNIGGTPYIFEAIAKSKGLVVDSVDLHPDRHKNVIETLNLNVEKVDIEYPSDERDRLRIADYDVVVLAEVLEHMRIDLIGTLKFICEGLRGGGYLYLTTPNFFFFRNFLYFIIRGRSGPPPVTEWAGVNQKHRNMGHVREYSKVELIELFEHVGFEIVDIKYRNRSHPIKEYNSPIIYKIFCAIMESSFDFFAQELVFVLRKKN